MKAWSNIFYLLAVAMFASASYGISCDEQLTQEQRPFEWIRPQDTSSLHDFLPPRKYSENLPPSNWSYGAESLLHLYASRIQPELPVLEVGSFLVPFVATYAHGNPWLVWESDSASASSIANGYPAQATVFRVDLDRLNSEQWIKFMEANRKALAAQQQPVGLAGAILSSMLTVDNYQNILREVMGLLKPGGILIITNSGLLGVPELASNRITEYLFMYYGDRIEVLPGTRLVAARVGAGQPALQLALKIKEPSATTATDLYREGVRMMADFSAPFGARYPEGVVDEAGKNEIREWYQTGREKRFDWYISRIEKDIAAAAHARPGSQDALALKYHLEDPSRLEWFMPERDILLQALEIGDLNERRIFIRKRLMMLYRRLGHH